MEYTIQKLAKLAGITTRTLRYYDGIGLLHPAYVNESGYRIYGETEVDALQQILLFRDMGMELSKIKAITEDASFNRVDILKEHLEVLKQRQQQIDLLIKNVNKTIEKEEGIRSMTDREKFEGLKEEIIQQNEKQYGEEIRQSYGSAEVDASNAKLMNLTMDEYEKMQETGKEINRLLEEAVVKKADSSGDLGQKIARLHKEWLSFTWTHYSKKAHCGLAEMYVADERFTAYYDQNVKGCARFLRDAVRAFNLPEN